MSDLLLLTNNEYDRSRYRSVGIVLATHVEAVSGIRAFAADLLGAFGNKSELLTKKSDDAVRSASQALIERGRSQYPGLTGVCDISFNMSGFTNEDNRTFLVVSVSGTALVQNTKGGRRRGTRKSRS